jgi:hypothetical protein
VALQVVYNSTIAPGVTVTPAAVAVTVTKGIGCSFKVVMNGTDNGTMPEVDLAYAFSIDNGTTYSDFYRFDQDVPWSSTGHEFVFDLLVQGFADHVQFQMRNNDPVNTATVTLDVNAY